MSSYLPRRPPGRNHSSCYCSRLNAAINEARSRSHSGKPRYSGPAYAVVLVPKPNFPPLRAMKSNRILNYFLPGSLVVVAQIISKRARATARAYPANGWRVSSQEFLFKAQPITADISDCRRNQTAAATASVRQGCLAHYLDSISFGPAIMPFARPIQYGNNRSRPGVSYAASEPP